MEIRGGWFSFIFSVWKGILIIRFWYAQVFLEIGV